MNRTRPSHTALKIARMTLFVAEHPVLGPLVPAQMGATNERLLQAIGAYKPWHRRVYRSRWFAALVRVSDRYVPGMMAHMALRKRFVDDEVVSAIEGGARQVVVLGAGLDGLAARQAALNPSVSFIELDHPVTQPAKAEALEGAGLWAENLTLAPADLMAAPLREALGAAPAWDDGAQTVFVAEGLLMYLSPEVVRSVLQSAREASGPGSRLVLTWVPRDARGQDQLGAVIRASLAAAGEALRWRPGHDELVDTLEATGWRPADAQRTDLHARYLAGTEHAAAVVSTAERVCVAERR